MEFIVRRSFFSVMLQSMKCTLFLPIVWRARMTQSCPAEWQTWTAGTLVHGLYHTEITPIPVQLVLTSQRCKIGFVERASLSFMIDAIARSFNQQLFFIPYSSNFKDQSCLHVRSKMYTCETLGFSHCWFQRSAFRELEAARRPSEGAWWINCAESSVHASLTGGTWRP